jgi:hypothetical protein
VPAAPAPARIEPPVEEAPPAHVRIEAPAPVAAPVVRAVGAVDAGRPRTIGALLQAALLVGEPVGRP